MSGRLEEIPGEEAFPAYLESNIARFYERAGVVRLFDGTIGSITIGGTVSPAGGNFEEPVTQGTLKVVGAFHGLSRERSDARKFPSVHPLDSWSKYGGIIPDAKVDYAKKFLSRGVEVEQMMKVVGEEGTSIDDFIIYLKGDFLDSVYLQQNSFQDVDKACSPSRQDYVFDLIIKILGSQLTFTDKAEARSWFARLRQKFIDYNFAPYKEDEFKKLDSEIRETVQAASKGMDAEAEAMMAIPPTDIVKQDNENLGGK
jgi:V/A-type H+-transporting ATPase subunit A